MDAKKTRKKTNEASKALTALGMPKEQTNERSALTLLALLDLTPNKKWSEAGAPLIGITPVMEFAAQNYGTKYKPNTRETFRRQTMHQFVQAGLVVENPDKCDRPTNSPDWVYQIEPKALALLLQFGNPNWPVALKSYLKERPGLEKQYARLRDSRKIPLTINGQPFTLSPGAHSELIREIIEKFGPRFAPGSEIVYAGDTGAKMLHCNNERLLELGIKTDAHGKFPDVILFFREKNWLFLIESVTSHGPMNPKRHAELSKLFHGSKADLIFVSAFPDRRTMARFLPEVSWETEVWVAESPDHLIHFNGEKFLGPYSK